MSVPMGGGYYQASPEVSLDWISKAWTLFTQKAALWIGTMFLFVVAIIALEFVLMLPIGGFAAIGGGAARSNSGLPGSTFFSLMAPLQLITFSVFGIALSGAVHIAIGGILKMGLKQVRGEEPALSDIFSVGDVALQLFIAGVITSFATAIASYLLVLPGIVLYGLLMFTPLLIVDRKLGAIDAIRTSLEMLKSQWLMAGVFILVAYLVACLGAIACVVGMLATFPLFFLSIAYGYWTFTETARSVPGYGAAQPGVWPPPPGAGNAPSFGQTGAGPQSVPGAWPPAQPATQPGAWPPAQPATPSGDWSPAQEGAPNAPSSDWPAQTPPPPYDPNPPASPDDPNKPFGGA